jgi:hypothetical protein
MRLKNAISGMFLLVLGLCVGSAVAMLVMAFGVIGPSKLHRGPAIVTFDKNWDITGIVTPDHQSNIPGADPNNTLFHNGRLGGKDTSRVKLRPGSRGKADAVR